MSDVAYRHGHFAWRELVTSDLDRSQRFYGDLFGWRFERAPMADAELYVVIVAGERTIGGMVRGDGSPHWRGYVSVADVDVTAASAIAAGGAVIDGPRDAGDIGRFAIVRDPQGAAIAAWRAAGGDPPPSPRPHQGEPVWEQLNSDAPDAAFSFHHHLFGWSVAPFRPGGLRMLSSGDSPVAGLMQAPLGTPAHWLTYFVVDDLAAAEARTLAGGGAVLVARIEAQGKATLGVIRDDVGAVLGLTQLG